MDDLVERLLAAIDAKEQLALIADGSPDWRLADDPMGSLMVVDGSGDVVIYDEGAPRLTQAAHIVDNDPKTVLDRCAADRVLVNIVRHVMPDYGAALSTLARIVIRQLADGYGITETEERIDLSGIDLSGDASDAAGKALMEGLGETTLKLEGFFTPAREHVDGPDCWCSPVAALVHHSGVGRQADGQAD